MPSIASDAVAFRRHKQAEIRLARAIAAASLSAGIDLPGLRSADPPERAAARLALRRRLERERQRGVRGQFGYDLDRHIALKQACDLLDSGLDPQANGHG